VLDYPPKAKATRSNRVGCASNLSPNRFFPWLLSNWFNSVATGKRLYFRPSLTGSHT
jgi:hypothetical protein